MKLQYLMTCLHSHESVPVHANECAPVEDVLHAPAGGVGVKLRQQHGVNLSLLSGQTQLLRLILEKSGKVKKSQILNIC